MIHSHTEEDYQRSSSSSSSLLLPELPFVKELITLNATFTMNIKRIMLKKLPSPKNGKGATMPPPKKGIPNPYGDTRGGAL